VFGCDRGAQVGALDGSSVTTISLICIGQLPPSFIEYALRGGAAGVLVTGCRSCEYRLGARWTGERLAASREPRLRASVPRERIAVAWADAGDEPRLRSAERCSAALRCAPAENAIHG
jgi:coenzyme F420-reducing hydrogenase delta subunit